MATATTYEQLVERGCLCGTDRAQDCELHGPGDNRGIAAFYRAGMPLAFPSYANCMLCGAAGLMYPDVELDDPNHEPDGPTKHRPTLICPRCSTPRAEQALRSEVEVSGLHKLNGRSVFGGVAEVAA